MPTLTTRTFATTLLVFLTGCIIWLGPIDLEGLEIIIIAIVALIAIVYEHRKQAFFQLGFRKEHLSVTSLLIVAPIVALVLFGFYLWILTPAVVYLTGQPMDFSDYTFLVGDLPSTLALLPLIWISAAFAEEIIWRGYLMRQFIKIWGDSRMSLIINIIVCNVIFGILHGYQGLSGQIITGIVGVILSLVFYFRKYDLWFNVVLHGCFDTVALICIYQGWFIQ